MKAILEIPVCRVRSIPKRYRTTFSFLYIPAPKSIFKNIRKVLPGHYLVVSREGIRETEYWDLSFNRIELTEERGASDCLIPTGRRCVFVS